VRLELARLSADQQLEKFCVGGREQRPGKPQTVQRLRVTSHAVGSLDKLVLGDFHHPRGAVEEGEGRHQLRKLDEVLAFPEEGDEQSQGILALKLQDTAGGIF